LSYFPVEWDWKTVHEAGEEILLLSLMKSGARKIHLSCQLPKIWEEKEKESRKEKRY